MNNEETILELYIGDARFGKVDAMLHSTLRVQYSRFNMSWQERIR